MIRPPVLSRRVLLAGLAAAPLARAAASERIGVGVIGTGRQARTLLAALLREPDVQVVAVCDVDKSRRDDARRSVETHYGKTAGAKSDSYRGCASIGDHRELLARRDLDAVMIATPDHWHAIQAIEACKARKDVYCEKPLAYTIHEARTVMEAARKHGRVFQTGSQQCAEYDGRFRLACEHVRAGHLGKLIAIYAGLGGPSRWCDLPGDAMEPGLDWERWLGPAPLRPYNSALSPRGVHDHFPTWRQYREYAGGMMTDWGAHHFDVAQWALDADHGGPVEVIPPEDPKAERGVRFVYPGGVELVHGGAPGLTFVGTAGTLFVDRTRLAANPEKILQEPLSEKEERLPVSPGHLRDFLDCVRTRKRPLCDAEVGARSATVCHLGNVAYWTGKRLKWDPQAWKLTADEEALKLVDRERRDPYRLPGVG